MESLPLTCDCGCKETEKRNIRKEDIDGTPVEVEYSLHCKDCGKVADVMPMQVKIEGNNACVEREFEVEGYSIEFFGRCKTCKDKKV